MKLKKKDRKGGPQPPLDQPLTFYLHNQKQNKREFQDVFFNTKRVI